MANQKNSVKTYLSPLYKRLTESMSNYTGMAESRIVADAVKEKFDKMTFEEREIILKKNKLNE